MTQHNIQNNYITLHCIVLHCIICYITLYDAPSTPLLPLPAALGPGPRDALLRDADALADALDEHFTAALLAASSTSTESSASSAPSAAAAAAAAAESGEEAEE